MAQICREDRKPCFRFSTLAIGVKHCLDREPVTEIMDSGAARRRSSCNSSAAEETLEGPEDIGVEQSSPHTRNEHCGNLCSCTRTVAMPKIMSECLDRTWVHR